MYPDTGGVKGWSRFMVGTELKTDKLPSVPEVLLKLVAACRKPLVSLDEVVSIVKHDAALSARVIAMGSARSHPEKIDQAGFRSLVADLGVEVIVSLASSTAVNQYFSRSWSGSGRYIALWRHSLECACMARSLARAIDYPDPEEAYFAGLLHNLGRWIWLAQFPEQYAAAIGNERDEAQTLAAERDLFGQTSIEMSASLMERWTRDGLISDAVLFQGESVDAVSDSLDLIRLLNLSRRLMGSEPWEEKSVFQDADELTGISASRLLEIRKEALADQQEIMRGYGFHTSREGFVVGGANVRRALNQHVHDTALVGSVNVYASDDAWLAAVQQFETLFGVSGLVAFEYLPKENVLRAGRFGSGVGSARLERMEVPVRPNRNLLAEACISRRAMSTLNAELPAFNSVLHTQLRRLFGKEELLALPVVSGDEVLGVIVAGLSREMLQDLLASDGILDYFLDVVARQLSAHARCEEERGRTGESQVQELVARTRRLIHEANNPLGVVANYLQILSLTGC